MSFSPSKVWEELTSAHQKKRDW